MSNLLIILSPILILSWINLFYIIFKNKKETNQDLTVASIILLYLFSLFPIGLFVGYYINNKKIKINNLREKKYSRRVQINGDLILIISISSTIFSILNILQ